MFLGQSPDVTREPALYPLTRNARRGLIEIPQTLKCLCDPQSTILEETPFPNILGSLLSLPCVFVYIFEGSSFRKLFILLHYCATLDDALQCAITTIPCHIRHLSCTFYCIVCIFNAHVQLFAFDSYLWACADQFSFKIRAVILQGLVHQNVNTSNLCFSFLINQLFSLPHLTAYLLYLHQALSLPLPSNVSSLWILRFFVFFRTFCDGNSQTAKRLIPCYLQVLLTRSNPEQ